MRNIVLAAIAGAALSLASAGAQALPFSPSEALAPAGVIDQVAEGCGPGMFRGGGGRCRPMRGGMGRGGYGRPGFGPRRCVVRVTPFGPRRVCR